MKNSLTITTAIAAAMLAAGCQQQPVDDGLAFQTDQPTAVCTDGNGNRVDDDLCDTNRRTGGGGFAFVYLNTGSRVPAYGSRVSGGSYRPMAGSTYAKSSVASVSRGGFGSSASARGGSFGG